MKIDSIQLGGILCVAAMLAMGCSRNTNFPSQPVTLVCPWSAGGGTDRVSRQIAAQLEREIGFPVNVVNATGGAGVTGHARGALARPDGYTITMITVELNMLHWRGLTNITHEDFSPIVLLNRDSAALFVPSNSSYQTLDDLESAIRAEPGKLKASGTAQGGIWHVAMAGWLNVRRLNTSDANWISINGAGPSLQELMAGGVDFVCCALPEADAMLSGGQVRCLGVMSEKRIPEFEKVATFREQGHDWSLAGWRGIAVPRDTPKERIDVLTKALATVAMSDEFSAFMRNSGFDKSVELSDKFVDTLATQDEMFRGVLQSSAFRQVSNEHFGLMIFPSIIVVLLVAVGGFVLLSERQHILQQDAVAFEFRSLVNPAAAFGAVVFFILAVEALGFIVTATMILFGLLVQFRVRLTTSFATAAITSLLVYQVFAAFLRVPLPRGLIGW